MARSIGALAALLMAAGPSLAAEPGRQAAYVAGEQEWLRRASALASLAAPLEPEAARERDALLLEGDALRRSIQLGTTPDLTRWDYRVGALCARLTSLEGGAPAAPLVLRDGRLAWRDGRPFVPALTEDLAAWSPHGGHPPSGALAPVRCLASDLGGSGLLAAEARLRLARAAALPAVLVIEGSARSEAELASRLTDAAKRLAGEAQPAVWLIDVRTPMPAGSLGHRGMPLEPLWRAERRRAESLLLAVRRVLPDAVVCVAPPMDPSVDPLADLLAGAVGQAGSPAGLGMAASSLSARLGAAAAGGGLRTSRVTILDRLGAGDPGGAISEWPRRVAVICSAAQVALGRSRALDICEALRRLGVEVDLLADLELSVSGSLPRTYKALVSESEGLAPDALTVAWRSGVPLFLVGIPAPDEVLADLGAFLARPVGSWSGPGGAVTLRVTEALGPLALNAEHPASETAGGFLFPTGALAPGARALAVEKLSGRALLLRQSNSLMWLGEFPQPELLERLLAGFLANLGEAHAYPPALHLARCELADTAQGILISRRDANPLELVVGGRSLIAGPLWQRVGGASVLSLAVEAPDCVRLLSRSELELIPDAGDVTASRFVRSDARPGRLEFRLTTDGPACRLILRPPFTGELEQAVTADALPQSPRRRGANWELRVGAGKHDIAWAVESVPLRDRLLGD